MPIVVLFTLAVSPAGQKALQHIAAFLLAAAIALPAREAFKDADDAPPASLPQEWQGEVVTGADAASTKEINDLVTQALSQFTAFEAARLLRRYRRKPKKDKIGVQYELTATVYGDYWDLNKKHYVLLDENDTWKYGETLQWDPPTKKQKRYSKGQLKGTLARGLPLDFIDQVQGTKNIIVMAETAKIGLYRHNHHDNRPPGNASPYDR